MPLYEYQCDACAHRFEVIQKYSDPHIEVCPKCGGAVKKLLSSPAIQFKGTGWYITDYARAGKTDPGAVAAGKNKSGGSSGKSESGDSGAKSDAGGKSESGGTSESGTSEKKSDGGSSKA